MTNLHNVTLVCADTLHPYHALNGIRECLKHATFAEVCFFTDADIDGAIKIPKLAGWSEYSRFIMNTMVDYVKSDYILITQWDGYILNTNFDPVFYEYDYIGHLRNNSKAVNPPQNGGFSWRSTRLQKHVQNRYHVYHPEDMVLSNNHRKNLENDGFMFAPNEIAKKFARGVWRGDGGWGFHSKKTAPRIPLESCPRTLSELLK